MPDPTASGPLARALADGLVQPDPTTCGSAVLVVARMVNDPAYAEYVVAGRHPVTGLLGAGSLAERFRTEALTMHRRTTLPVDVSGRLQVPWLQRFGTAPWAVARQMTGGAGVRGASYTVSLVLPHRREQAFDRIVAAVAAGHVVPVYVGSRWLPRHVVLVVAAEAGGLRIYEPSRGRRLTLARGGFVAGRLVGAGWPVPWCAVVPTT